MESDLEKKNTEKTERDESSQSSLGAKFILGVKENMSQVFNEEGHVIPITIISATPMVVTQVKSVEKDGYKAVQVGFGNRKEKNISKPVKGHMKDLGNFSHLKEFKSGEKEYSVGDTIKPDIFSPGDIVSVSAISKGKGFQGVVKRHGFAGGPRTHGQKHSEREGGSIGGGGRSGGRVVKGMKMPGRMGGERITVKNLKVVGVDLEKNIIIIRGAVPGRRGTLVEVRN